MRDVSVTEQIMSLLEENWSGLKTELSAQWGEFLASYRAVVETLPPEPVQEDVARATIRLLELLRQSEAGRRLLRKNSDLQTRLMGSGSETLPSKVPVKQVANRMIDLLKREEGKKKQNEAGDAKKD